jgi:hypothetical protein
MEVEKGQTRKIQGKVVKVHRCPATVRGTKAAGKTGSRNEARGKGKIKKE